MAALTGNFGLMVENLKTFLANLSAFQTWTGTANATAAGSRIHRFYATESSVTRPMALIDFGEDLQQAVISAGGQFDVHPRGDLMLYFEADAASDDEAGFVSFVNGVESVIAAMQTAMAQRTGAVQLAVTGFQPVMGPVIRGVERPRTHTSGGRTKEVFWWAWQLGYNR